MTIEVLKKLKENKCTDKELHEIYRWLASPDKEAEATAFLKSSWREAHSTEKGFEDLASVSKMRKEIWTQIANSGRLNGGSIETKINKKNVEEKYFIKGWMKVAATILLLIGSILAFWYTSNISNTVEKVAIVNAYVEKSNPRGQKSTVFLRDGSKVILNSSSTIRYASNFGELNRDIELVGEAFFKVTKNKDLPFNVTSGDITTTALGTSFNIRAYPLQQKVHVALVTGKTRTIVNGNLEIEFLNPGQSIEYNSRNNEIKKDTFDSKEVLSWKDGILYFENKKFEEVAIILEEWYDVEFDINYGDQDSSKYDGIKGSFKNASLENVLKVMSHAREFYYEIKGKKVNIKFR